MPVRYPRIQPMHHACPQLGDRQQDRQPPVNPYLPPPRQPVAALPTGLAIDLDRRTVTAAGRVLRLTYLEFELLAHLAAHPRRVHTRVQLLNTVWGQPAVGDARTVDVHVARLRRKLGPAYRAAIATVRHVGYSFDPASAARTETRPS